MDKMKRNPVEHRVLFLYLNILGQLSGGKSGVFLEDDRCKKTAEKEIDRAERL